MLFLITLFTDLKTNEQGFPSEAANSAHCIESLSLQPDQKLMYPVALNTYAEKYKYRFTRAPRTAAQSCRVLPLQASLLLLRSATGHEALCEESSDTNVQTNSTRRREPERQSLCNVYLNAGLC